MAGLPGSGKSTVADVLSVKLGAVLSVDPIEAALWRSGVDRQQPTGLAAYVVAEELARVQLGLGHDVVVDTANDVAAAREQWRLLARKSGARLIFVEVVCTDAAERRRRRAMGQAPDSVWAVADAVTGPSTPTDSPTSCAGSCRRRAVWLTSARHLRPRWKSCAAAPRWW
ncbi:AAA family ATPase [Rhodococcus sp. H29-C3]|uniref:AAA family ATPase n=1 Tax=Rhodococcus sp. H29-C3 TaxID=3046307 RepID=UPI0024BBD332|nr:AAA family ATPase [Rhodococcus sp. H29-C3]MDJ0362992.1 AAA family ATPase [Rhodococcus sp. H29-C3]